MTHQDADVARIAVLRAELQEDGLATDQLIEAAVQLADLYQAETRNAVATGLLNGLALSLHHVYSAIEAGFERIAKYLDQRLPDGADWHAELLRQMALDLPGVRPPFLPSDLRARLDEYRRLRHVIRRSYEFELDWDRMAPLVKGLPGLRRDLAAALSAFDGFLAGLMHGLNQ